MKSRFLLGIVLSLVAFSSLACDGDDSVDGPGDVGPGADAAGGDDAAGADGSDGGGGSGDAAPADADVRPEAGDVAADGADGMAGEADAAADAGSEPPMEKKVLAFYYPWYRTPEFSGFWKHWNEEGHNPDKFVSEGRRDIASVNYPSIGVYDSLDPEVIDRHIKQSVEAGIDAWIISWWGDDKEIQTIMDRINALQSPLKVTAYYERIPGCSGDLCPELSDEKKVTRASSDIVDLLESLSDDPAWLTVDGEPVLFTYIRAVGHGWGHWDSIIEKVESTHPVFISGDVGVTGLLEAFGRPTFDQMHNYNPTGQIERLGEGSLEYGKFCKTARRRGQSCAVTVIPGYDDSALPSREPIILDREGGALYERLWKHSMAADADWILITSFNEWHEGTDIEPSLEFGDAYLKATKNLAETFKSPEQ